MLRYRPMLSDVHPIQYVWETYLQACGSTARPPPTRRTSRSTTTCRPSSATKASSIRRRARTPHGVLRERRRDCSRSAWCARSGSRSTPARIKPGVHVLDIGGGWGSFLEYAGKRGVHVTSVTISKASARCVRDLIARDNLPCEVIPEHLLELKVDTPGSARSSTSTSSEHLPDYRATLAQCDRLLVPGGRIYLDAYTGPRFNAEARSSRAGSTRATPRRCYLDALRRGARAHRLRGR